uniref:Uncharacterized protein n=1 Tax=Alexandrium andersonii TaxID=327968 RepID=A0A7S2BKM6_9DINO
MQSITRMFTFGSTKRRNTARQPPLTPNSAGSLASGTSPASGSAGNAAAASSGRAGGAWGGGSEAQRPAFTPSGASPSLSGSAGPTEATSVSADNGSSARGGISMPDSTEEESLTREWQFL